MSLALSVTAILLSLMALYLAVCIYLGARTARGTTQPQPVLAELPVTCVLVPAHNEQDVLPNTLTELLRTAPPNVSIVVVADNCSDDTAKSARRPNVQVVERNDPDRIGKAFALDYGRDYLSRLEQTPDVVVVLDADSIFSPGSLHHLITAAWDTSQPAQAKYLMSTPGTPGPAERIRDFALLIKNHVRPLGQASMRLPCQLTGSGMAFPWPLFNSLSLNTGHLVEDMVMGLECASLSSPPTYCQASSVSSPLPTDPEAIQSQRRRWEHGHLSLLFGPLPRYLSLAIRKGNPKLAAMILDLSIPPLTFFYLMLTAACIASWVNYWLSGPTPLTSSATTLATSSIGLLSISLVSAWRRFDCGRIKLSELVEFVCSKLSTYAEFFGAGSGRQRKWVRTGRSKSQ